LTPSAFGRIHHPRADVISQMTSKTMALHRSRSFVDSITVLLVKPGADWIFKPALA